MVQIARMLKEGISILGEQPTNMVRQQVININLKKKTSYQHLKDGI
jgi:hypothetical protein